MGSFAPAVRALTNHVLSDLHRDVVPRERYTIFDAAICANFGIMIAANLFTPTVGTLSTWPPGACEAVRCVLLRMNVMTVLGNEGGQGQHNRTWAHVATVLANALAIQRGVHLDNFEHFRVAMFVRRLRAQVTVPVAEVRQRQNALARDVIQFVVNEVTLEDDHFAGLEVDELQMEFILPDNVPQPVAEQPQMQPVAEQPQMQPVAEQPQLQPVAEEPVEEEPVEEEPVEEEPVEEEPVEEEPQLEPEVDEDGDTVMDTEEVAPRSRGSKRRGSKRRGSYAVTHEDEVKRAKRAKEEHGLRDTAARKEWLRKLRKADKAKRKVDGEAEGSSKDSRKRSRR